MTHIQQMADLEQRIEDAWRHRQMRPYKTHKAGCLCLECLSKDASRKPDRIEFKSAGATRKR